VYQTINAAVLSKSEFTVILIPKLEKYVWKHPKLKLICWWESNSFVPLISDTNQPATPEQKEMLLYVVTDTPIEISDHFKEKIKNISSIWFKCCPVFQNTKKSGNKSCTYTPTPQLFRQDIPFGLPSNTNKNKNQPIPLWYYLYKLNVPDNLKKQIYRAQDTQNHKETKSPQQIITDQMVFKVKKLIPDCLMVSVKDKNVGQLRVECQIYAQRRIQKEIVSSKSFKKSNRRVHDILEDLKREYKSADVNHLGYWYKGSLPEDYTLPKQKDPIHK